MRREDVEEAVADEPVDWVEEQLEAWLKKEDWQVEEFVRLLEGYEIPLGALAEEPYLALLEALPRGGDRYTRETELARRAADLLARKPDEIPVGDTPQRLLYNLLLLCAGLACPDQLADPLFALWQRRALKGEWQGLDLRYALNAALASNQLDSRMALEWWALLEERPTTFLPGSDYDGFEALLWMPGSAETRGEPVLEAIGKALKTMAGALEKSKNRRPEFRVLIRKVKETYPDRRSWDEDLIYAADRNGFPGWAVECLPRLFIELKTQNDDSKIVFLWHVLSTCMNELDGGWRKLRAYCAGRVVEARISESLFPTIRDFALRIEERRNNFQLASDEALMGSVSDLLVNVEESRSSYEMLRTLSRGRRTIVEKIRAARKKAA